MRRWLVLRSLFPHTVVFFYSRGAPHSPEPSWRIRDYSAEPMQEHGPDDLNLTHDEVLRLATLNIPAPPIPVDDPDWVEQTRILNEKCRHLLQPPDGDPVVLATPPTPPRPNGHNAIPILDEKELRQQRDGLALTRILTSRNSEDWVSWTVFRLLPSTPGWWPAFLHIAKLNLDAKDVPKVKFWREVPSPALYQTALRERMAASTHLASRERAANPCRVEDPTEVDIVLEGHSFLFFIEAKLRGDLAPDTTNDPTRNQLARNVDVLLEQVGPRRAVMGILAPTQTPRRRYTQLVNLYQRDPSKILALLPHRTTAEIESVARDLRLLVWTDLLPLIYPPYPAAVMAELRRRLGLDV